MEVVVVVVVGGGVVALVSPQRPEHAILGPFGLVKFWTVLMLDTSSDEQQDNIQVNSE